MLIHLSAVALNLSVSLVNASSPTAPAHVAIFGDSGASGVIADPRWSANYELGAVIALRAPLKRTLLDYSSSFGAYKDIYQSFGISLPLAVPHQYAPQQKNFGKTLEVGGAFQLDLPEMSWGYFTGRAFGANSNDIYFFARDGKRVDNLSEQIDTMNEQFPNSLPELTLISFTANDFCSPSVLNAEGKAQALQNYEGHLRISFNKLLERNAYKEGSTVVLMSPLPVTKILRSKSVMDKEISILGQKLSCRQVRSDGKVMFRDKNVVDALQGMCPSIMKTAPGDEARIKQLEEIFEQALDIQRQVVNEAQIKSKGIRFFYFDEVFYSDLDAKDIANDCFHPSIYAHEKIAKKLIDFLVFQRR